MSDEIEIELDAMAHGGSALGRQDGRTVFVPYTIPGERVRARIVETRGRVAFAEGVTLLDASADRVYPRCKHFGLVGRCGRCHWQHIDYQAQLLLKQDVLADQLARIGGLDDADVRAVIPSADEWGYNYHMTMSMGDDGKLGFPAIDKRGIVPIEECHILHPDLLALYHSLDLDFDGLRRVRFQLGSDDRHMLILTMADENAPELETDMPTSVNMLLEDGEPINLIGDSHSRYIVNGRSFRVTAGSSFRPNVSQLPNLVQAVLDALHLQGSESILDLYGGVGLLSAFIAQNADLVTLVESFPPAATDADENLSAFENVDIIEGSVEDALSDLENEYDTAIVDPPGDGLNTTVTDALATRAIRRLVYVSDDPATLARDAKRLVAHGYRLVYAQPIDLAPQTYYVDSVAVFER
jgi:23S rRNA (uracil1939-C5)-methyltransferase